MRVRGTNITDIVILVVDAVEGPLEQTIESLRAIRKSQCNMVVVCNFKIKEITILYYIALILKRFCNHVLILLKCLPEGN